MQVNDLFKAIYVNGLTYATTEHNGYYLAREQNGRGKYFSILSDV